MDLGGGGAGGDLLAPVRLLVECFFGCSETLHRLAHLHDSPGWWVGWGVNKDTDFSKDLRVILG